MCAIDMSVDRTMREDHSWPGAAAATASTTATASTQREILTFTHNDLDFSRFVARLSSRGTFPDSFHVRNTLISALSSAKLWTRWTPALDPWAELFEYLGPTSRVIAFGQVPVDVLTPAAARRRTGPSADTKGDASWGVVITAMRWKTRDGQQPPRIQVWLSNRGSPRDRQALAHWVSATWLPSFCAETRQPDVIFSGVDLDLGEELKVASPLVKVDWENPCVVYFRNAEKQGWLINKYPPPPEYQVGTIEERHLDLVYKTNKLSFPTDMIFERAHLSVMISSKEGAPLGWAYGHEDLTIGSLHVLPEYRRTKGVGSSVIVHLEPKLVFAQRQALWRAGVDENQIDQDERYGIAPYCGMIEEGNIASRGLSHYFKGDEASPNTWMGVKVDIPRKASL